MLKRQELLLTIFVVILAARTSLNAASVAFKPAQNYTVGTNPRAVVVGDFNHDGKMDLAVVNRGDPTTGDDGSVSILFGNADGTFQAAKNLNTCKNCTGAAVGDFNGDGIDDIALVRPGDVSANDNGDITIFLGNGDGTFRQGGVLTPGKNPSGSIVAIDLNGDQRLDLIVVIAGGNSVSVLLGNGDGTFQPPVAYATATPPSRVQVVDLAGTGETDLAVVRQFGLDFLLGNGDGTFRPGPSLSCCFFGGVSAMGDFNNDRKVDRVETKCNIFSHVCGQDLLLGNGDGTFQQGIMLGQFVAAAADFNGDGNLDGVGGVPQTPQVQVLQGNGDGTFLQAVSFAVGGSGTPGIALAEDINGDKAPDIVAFNVTSTGSIENSISVLVNIGTDFTISASKPSPSTLTAGQSATSTISLNLLSAFNNPVSLACSVQPAQAGAPTCSLSSNSVTFDGSGKASATLTINVGSSVASRNSFQSFSNGGWLWFPVAGFAFFGTSVSVSRKRRLQVVLIGAALVGGLITQVACGGGSSGSKSAAYTVTVTGNSSTTQHSTTVNLTVQ